MGTRLTIAEDLALPLEAVTEKIGFLGRTGSGKTYAAQLLAEQMHAAAAQFVVLDPVGVWYGLRLEADGKSPGIALPVFGGLRGDVPLEPGGGALIANLVVDRALSAVVDVSQFESDAQKARFAQDFADRFFFRKKASPSAVHLFVEECQEFVPQNPQRDEARMLHAFTRLWKLGRNFGIGGSLLSQRPQEVNKKVLNLTELLFCFQLTGPQERKTIKGWIAEKGIDEDIDLELPKLETGHPHVWSPAWLKVSKVVAVSSKRTFDASSTPKVGRRAAARELSPIDLDALRSEMAATVERAKAEDPRELRRQIAELKKELTKKPAAAVPAKEKRIEIPVLKDGMVKRLEAAITRAQAIGAQLDARLQDVVGWSIQLRNALAAQQTPPGIRTVTVWRPPELRGQTPASPASRREISGSGAMARGERKILTAIAQHAGGVSRDQLTVLTGYKRSTRDAYLQRLGGREFIIVNGDAILATDAGVSSLGPSFERLPTGDELREYWIQRLPAGERRILRTLIEAYPESIERHILGERTGYQRSSRDAYLQRLKAWRLVEIVYGAVRAAGELFS